MVEHAKALSARYTSWGKSVFVRYSPKTGLAAEDHFPPSHRRNSKTGKPHGMLVKRIYNPDQQNNSRPLLFFPGAWCNGNIFRGTVDGKNFRDVDHFESFANLAAERGFDAWVFHGWSPRIWTRYVERYYFRDDFVHPSRISFEDSLTQDIPPFLDYIERVTGKSRFGWIGHSMGGMKGYAYAGCAKDPRVAAIATLASPVTFTEEQRTILLMALISFMYLSAGFSGFNPFQLASSYMLPLSRLAPANPGKLPLIWNPENITDRQAQFMVKKVSEPLPIHIFYFFVQMILTRKFTSLPEGGFTELNWAQIVSDFLKHRGPSWLPTLPFLPRGQVNYFKELQNIRCPILAVYGGKDKIATEEAVLPAVESVSSNVREAIGVPDAGHVDIMLGKNSRLAWEQVLDFLGRNLD